MVGRGGRDVITVRIVVRGSAASTAPMSDSSFSDAVGLIVGVANKRSISWAIAKAAAERGARLVLTYQNARLEENVRDLASTLEKPVLLPCDVTNDGELDALVPAIERECGRLDFVVHGAAFAEREDLDRPFVETSREGLERRSM